MSQETSLHKEIGEAEQAESTTAGLETESESSPEVVNSVCKEICEAGEVHCMGKNLLVNLGIERKEVQFRIDTRADLSLLDESS